MLGLLRFFVFCSRVGSDRRLRRREKRLLILVIDAEKDAHTERSAKRKAGFLLAVIGQKRVELGKVQLTSRDDVVGRAKYLT